MPGVQTKKRVLECDIGNSRCKWRLISSENEVLKRGVFYHSKGFNELPEVIKDDVVKVANVAGENTTRAFLEQLAGRGAVVEFAKTSEQAAGVVNTYENIKKLGVDRWLAAIAAYKHCGTAVLVIDIGSAINVELVSGKGVYLGGYIAPGAELMKRALLSDTGLVRFSDISFSPDLEFGQSTVAAVSGGISAALVGVSRVAIDLARHKTEGALKVVVTGGGASDVIGHLDEDAIEVPDLVLDGLRWVLP